ncbi:Myeloid-associated differentiation marker-like protein 2 [Triplophysa tibetana]|uniref:Myeloid-associated differentiation marker-like protein 2 n=1 Tax=Triplophysa tibetana TaxID=1572043 RepID=A0A5A9MVS8_9TELE|nr:Myeloid-associated differentiation marker-like protein 2 [Triplophysa tibetana]
MNASDGHQLNRAAVLSPTGAARMCQLTLGCAVISLVTHNAGYSATYGTLCMAVWSSCFAITGVVFVLDVTRLHTCLPVSWENATVTFAALAVLLTLTASTVYPVYFLSSECPRDSCEIRNFRIAVTVCSWAACVAYGAEVHLSRGKPGHAAGYMATTSGILKVVQSFTGCLIFGLLANGSDFTSHGGTVFCVVVFVLCFSVTVLVVVLTVSGRTALLPLPFQRFVVVYTFTAVLLYLSAAVLWPVFCFDRKYGKPLRPQGCPRGKCSWDVKLGVTVLCFVNLALYIADLVCSQRKTSVRRHPRV